ncbi:MAG: response regulator transcription factor [Lachnospiraceae bacterium]|jgi:two-component system vancomycin resistance associated response regulator VraR|nr:response regulator transcription factor [Lachnospiraceae bacterium]
MTKVAIVDDQNITRQFFSYFIKDSEEFELVATLKDGEEAIDYCKKNPLDLILMDIVMVGGMNGLDAAKEIKAFKPQIKIIIITSMPEVSYIERAREIGVDSFWYKELEEVPILTVMERTMKGEHIYPDSTPELMIGNAKSTEFTDIELEILREVTTGATNKEISEKLFVSPATVNYYINDLLVKTGYKNRVQLAVKARLEGLVISDEKNEDV